MVNLRLVLLLGLTNMTIQCPQHFIDGKRFNGITFKTILKCQLFSCAAECTAYSLCKSVSFDKKNMTCFLHLEDDSGQPDSLLSEPDFSYSPIKVWDNIVLGPCQKHACDPFQKCVVKRNQKRCTDKRTILSRGKQAKASRFNVNAPSKAVDGNRDPRWGSGSCFDILRSGGWWQADLGVPSFITDVLIVNRGDCCAERLRNFVLEAFTEDPSTDPTVEARARVCYRHPDEPLAAGATVTFNCTTPVVGRYFRVSIPNPLDSLNKVQLCEVEVYGWHLD